MGVETAVDRKITCLVKEEVTLPKEEWEARDWVGDIDLHPFWLIKRDTKTDKHNCEIRVEVLTQCSILDVTDW